MLGAGFSFQNHWDTYQYNIRGYGKLFLMLDLTYVRKKRRKKVVTAIAIIASVGVLTLSIISLLSKQAGAFSVSMTNGSVSLALSRDVEFTDPVPYLSEKAATCYREYTYDAFDVDFEEGGLPYFDDPYRSAPEATGEGNNKTIPFFKYTYYVKNLGSLSADYTLSLNMTQVGANTSNEKGVEASLRVAFFENYDHVVGEGDDAISYRLDDHAHKIYAFANHRDKPIRNPDTGVLEYASEPISTGCPELANQFVSNKVILTSEVKNLTPKQIVRYTFVIWIEGSDLDCSGNFPNNALKLGVTIDAVESKTEN